MSDTTAEVDEVLEALDDVSQAAVATRETTFEIERRASMLAGSRHSGRRWGEIVSDEHRPRLTELLSKSLRLLSDNGVRFRRALARAMHAEGMSTEEIARQFGVSRQRISNLLRRRVA
jgi:DNA invertase Pin-like site-specific DNA recombinase